MDGLNVEVVVHADTENVLSVELPQFVVMKVVYSEKGLREIPQQMHINRLR